ncbi:PorT family protein [Fulvivirga ulvae]|uniref:porin family protein n=1 Tax=Fulvivirga ulvae TaxID=2904245 RepID=UPI001F3A6383|nr:porin family protein [Fulvivirga ulvae]UII34031.1 PorT family protein [Fulvivirga ulvae]
MRKFLLLIIFMFVASTGFSQFKLGFKFSPTISTNRIDSKSDTVSLSTDGAGLRFVAGPIADFQLTENYFVSTGLLLVSKRAGLKAKQPLGTEVEEYSLQYIQIPVTLKLFTNEVALDKRIYFQMGATMEVNVKDDPKKDRYYYVEDFKLFDSSLLIGVGLEYKVGVNTIVFGGFSYSRGLLNTVGDHVRLDDDITLKNDYLALDLGIKF